jgi:hypothetical protein
MRDGSRDLTGAHPANIDMLVLSVVAVPNVAAAPSVWASVFHRSASQKRRTYAESWANRVNTASYVSRSIHE